MPKRLFVFFILVIFLLTACSGAEQTSPAEAPAAEQEAALIEPAPTMEEPESPAPTEDAAAGTGASIPATGAQMECTLVSDQPDVPAELVALFEVTEDDWVKGPDTAAVTFVEYSDFQ